MGCCCSRPVDEEDEKVVRANLAQGGIAGYGAITHDEEKKDINKPQFKEPIDQPKADNLVINTNDKDVTSVASPKKEKSNANTEASPLLETPPIGFEKCTPKNSSMKKTSKTMKDAGKKASEIFGKMFKRGGGGKDSPKKTRKAEQTKPKEKTDKAAAPSSKGAAGVTSTPATTKNEINPSGRSGDSANTSHQQGNIAGRSRMSERMRSTYARERMEKLEAKREREGRSHAGGFTDLRKAAVERGKKLSELQEGTDDMRNSAAGFAATVRQLKLNSEREAKS